MARALAHVDLTVEGALLCCYRAKVVVDYPSELPGPPTHKVAIVVAVGEPHVQRL
jgi:hypothetical protein